MKKPAAPRNPEDDLSLPPSGQARRCLDLPDAPDFRSSRSPVPLERMLDLLEQYRQWFPISDAEREQRRKHRCTEEFVL